MIVVVAGFLVAVGIGLAIVLRLARHGAARLDVHPWLLADTAKLHVTIMGGLAGFAVTGIVLLVSLARDQAGIEAASFDTVVVMFIVAYFYYVGNAFLISYLPHPETSGDLVPRVHFSLASTIEYRTLFVSWFALRPLLSTFGLHHIADVLAVLLPLSLALGSVVIAMAADGLGLMRLKEVYISAAVGTALALVYAGVIHVVAPNASTAHSALYLTIVIFCVNGVGFALAAMTPLSPRYPGVERFYERHGRTIVIADMQVTMLALTFLWLAVVGVI
jgi:hypothetical protein